MLSLLTNEVPSKATLASTTLLCLQISVTKLSLKQKVMKCVSEQEQLKSLAVHSLKIMAFCVFHAKNASNLFLMFYFAKHINFYFLKSLKMVITIMILVVE